MKIFLRVHAAQAHAGRHSHVIDVIDSDYDEDDEYQLYEMEDIFSISPANHNPNQVEELLLCDLDVASKEDDFGSEFDSDGADRKVPVGPRNFDDCDYDPEEEEEDCPKICKTGPRFETIRGRRHLD